MLIFGNTHLHLPSNPTHVELNIKHEDSYKPIKRAKGESAVWLLDLQCHTYSINVKLVVNCVQCPKGSTNALLYLLRQAVSCIHVNGKVQYEFLIFIKPKSPEVAACHPKQRYLYIPRPVESRSNRPERQNQRGIFFEILISSPPSLPSSHSRYRPHPRVSSYCFQCPSMLR